MDRLRRGIRILDEPTSLEGPVPLLDGAGARELLRSARRIAVIGASSHPWRASNSVMGYLLGQGYECVPVTPVRNEVLGQVCYDTLEDAVAASGGPFDIVDVFRRPQFVPDIARSAVATGCGALWLQLGVISWEAARLAHEGGLGVVMDRCSAIELRHLRTQAG
jgi:predicted CoA-binding protein